MINFVDLMEARSLGVQEDEQAMDKYWYSSQWIMEPIYMGIRYQCLIDEKNEIKFLGKKKTYSQQNSMYLLNNLMLEIKNLKLPTNTLFEGYLTFNNDQQKAYSFLKSNTFEDNDLQFFITDLIYLDNKPVFDFTLFDRKHKLQTLVNDSNFIKLQKGYVSKKKETYSSLKDQFKIFLFKDLESLYSFRQSMSWRILKTPKQFFMTVLGFVENEKEEYKNMVLALEGGQIRNGKITKIMNIPVHSDESRLYLFKRKQQILGKVFEFFSLDNAKNGKYQETRFIRMRDDKKQEDCIFVEEV